MGIGTRLATASLAMGTARLASAVLGEAGASLPAKSFELLLLVVPVAVALAAAFLPPGAKAGLAGAVGLGREEDSPPGRPWAEARGLAAPLLLFLPGLLAAAAKLRGHPVSPMSALVQAVFDCAFFAPALLMAWPVFAGAALRGWRGALAVAAGAGAYWDWFARAAAFGCPAVDAHRHDGFLIGVAANAVEATLAPVLKAAGLAQTDCGRSFAAFCLYYALVAMAGRAWLDARAALRR
jgi:hypothetical protein